MIKTPSIYIPMDLVENILHSARRLRDSCNQEIDSGARSGGLLGMFSICPNKDRDSQSVPSRAIIAILEIIRLMPLLATMKKIYIIALVVCSRFQLLR
jgi:hypothetical protein